MVMHAESSAQTPTVVSESESEHESENENDSLPCLLLLQDVSVSDQDVSKLVQLLTNKTSDNNSSSNIDDHNYDNNNCAWQIKTKYYDANVEIKTHSLESSLHAATHDQIPWSRVEAVVVFFHLGGFVQDNPVNVDVLDIEQAIK